MGTRLSDYMDMEQPDDTEPEDFYAPCASYGGRHRMELAHIAHTRMSKPEVKAQMRAARERARKAAK